MVQKSVYPMALFVGKVGPKTRRVDLEKAFSKIGQ